MQSVQPIHYTGNLAAGFLHPSTTLLSPPLLTLNPCSSCPADLGLLALSEALSAAVAGPAEAALNGVHFTPPVCADMLPPGLNNPEVCAVCTASRCALQCLAEALRSRLCKGVAMPPSSPFLT